VALGLIFAPFTIKTLIFLAAGVVVFAVLPWLTPRYFKLYGNRPRTHPDIKGRSNTARRARERLRSRRVQRGGNLDRDDSRGGRVRWLAL
jgi:hypothetical protein